MLNSSNETENGTFEYDYDYEYFDYHKYFADKLRISLIILSVEVIFGLFGNTLSLIVWNVGENSRLITCSTYFRLLSGSDILSLSSGFLCLVLPQIIKIKDTNFCSKFGAISLFLLRTPAVSTWITTFIALERMLSVCFPFTFRANNCRKRAWVAFVVSIIILIFSNFRVFTICEGFFADTFAGYELCYCKYRSTNRLYSDIDEILFYVCLLCVVPLIIVTCCNVVTAIKMFGMKRAQSQLNSSGRKDMFGLFTRLSIGIGVLHFVSTFPYMVFLLNSEFRTGVIGSDAKSLTFTIWNRDFVHLSICTATYGLNNALNWLLYMSGSAFRTDFKELFVRSPGSVYTSNRNI